MTEFDLSDWIGKCGYNTTSIPSAKVREFIKRLKEKKALDPKFIYLSVRELNNLAGEKLR